MSNESKRALDSVVFENNTMMFMANALTNREVSKDTLDECVEFGNRNRWAYLAVGYKESEDLRKNNPDSEELLKAIKTEYEPWLRESIKLQDGISKSQLQDKILNKDSKRIYLVESDVCATNSIKELLQVNNMHTKANKLEETHTKVGPRVTRMSLSFTRQGAQRLLDDDYVVAIVAVAYGYNGEDSSLKLCPLPKTMVAFTPRTRFECGVFFDGTNNNMYNTQMREAYEEYFRLKADMISGIKPKDAYGWESKILDPKVPESEILPLIFQDLKKYMEDKEIYGTKRQSQKEYNDGVIFGWGQNDVSKDCDAIYKYFRDSKIQEVLKEIQKIQKNDEFTDIQKISKINVKKEEFKLNEQTVSHIEDEILISGKDSSYTGALSNVAKLYECYDENVTKTTHKDADLFECFRDRIYVEGAGTHSDSKEKNDEADDWFLGQAFAIGDAGVKAKVNKACKKLHEKISNLGESYIDTLVLDVFGFSRGAAQARHFVSRLSKDLKCTFERKLQDKKNKVYIEYELTKGGENLYSHILKEEELHKDNIIIDKIVFRFIGVFDTVAHHGLIQGNDEEDLDLRLDPKKVSRVVHLTARDEFRYNFDLVSIFEKYNKEHSGEKEDNNFIEKEFFGAHSDVGGGYKDSIAEEVELPTQIRRLHYIEDKNYYDQKIIDKIKKWNKRHGWIRDMDDSKIINIKSYEKIGMVDGFYIKKRVHEECEERTAKYRIYMYRAQVDAEYSQVPLEYMYQYIQNILPMQPLKNLTYKSMEIDKVKVIGADEEHYKKLKPRFFHHSSSLGIAHKPNRGSENGLYGKRTIHYVKPSQSERV